LDTPSYCFLGPILFFRVFLLPYLKDSQSTLSTVPFRIKIQDDLHNGIT
jgi:hypothetical protein